MFTLQGLYDTFPVVLEHSDDRGRYLCASRYVAAGELVYRVRMARLRYRQTTACLSKWTAM